MQPKTSPLQIILYLIVALLALRLLFFVLAGLFRAAILLALVAVAVGYAARFFRSR